MSFDDKLRFSHWIGTEKLLAIFFPEESTNPEKFSLYDGLMTALVLCRRKFARIRNWLPTADV
jgi:hypothetical protein